MFVNPLKAQLTVDNTATLPQIVDAIIGPGFKVVNSSLNCPQNAIGLFDGTATNIGINNGVILTNGDANLAIGPNDKIDDGFNNGTPGYNLLDSLSGTTTFDACVLEIDLIPLCDTLRIQYVFGSEEYPEYVGRGFNDVFAFYVSGPGIIGEQNITLVPGTTDPVAVNTINAGTNAAYYIDNTGGNTIQYDAFTQVLEAKIAVQTCEIYHLTLAISDVTDGIFESGVFIQGNSVTCTSTTSSSITTTKVDAREDCLDGEITFCRDGDLTNAMTLPIQIGGVAQNGIDYTTIPNSVVFPANTACVTIPLVPINDGLTELEENIRIIYQSATCPIYDTINAYISDVITIDAGSDKRFCSEGSVVLGEDSLINYQYSWSPVTGLDNPNILRPTLSLTNNMTTPLIATYILTATDGVCTVTDSIEVIVDPKPTVDFQVENGCLGAEVNFTDNSINANQWLWDYGDGYIDVSSTPTHVYQTAGNHTVTLTITDNLGCSNTDSSEIEIWTLPVADFTVNNDCNGTPLDFVSTSTPGSDGNISLYEWKFGDLSPVNNQNNPQHLYSNSGVFNVVLKVTSDSGCVDSIFNQAQVYPTPNMSIITDTTCLFIESKIINNTTINNGVIASWLWDFGDGNTSTNQQPTHAYGAPGTYDIQLNSISDFGCTDSQIVQITILPDPTADFTTANVCFNEPVIFNDLSTVTIGGVINKWTWIFDSTYVDTNQNTSFNFPNFGTHNITLIIETDYGCKDTVFQNVEVFSMPSADFSVAEICEGDTAIFTNLSVATNPLDTITNYLWDFGDGSPQEMILNPKHLYNTGGSYDVQLIVSTLNGCSDTISKTLYVRYNPKADFTYAAYCVNSLSEFNDVSTVSDGFIQQWDWLFSDGTTSGTMNSNHTFTTSGNHDVRLLITTNYGCVDSITKTINLNAKPTAIIVPVDNHCIGSVQNFVDNSTSQGDPIIGWYWEFGNGFFSTIPNPSYVYPDTGTYTVTLIVSNSSGCSDTTTTKVTVWPLPLVNFLATNVCLGDSSVFVNQSTILAPNQNVLSSVWDFGDGSPLESGNNVSHMYNAAGTYDVSLIVSTDSGCVSVLTKKVSVYELPVVDFQADPVCPGEPIRFFNQTTLPIGSFSKNIDWDFGDGNTDNVSSPTHLYLNDSIYNVKLKVTTNFGCVDSIIKPVEMFPLPEIIFTVDTNSGCAPLEVTFKVNIISNTAGNLTDWSWDFGDGMVSTEKEPTYTFNDDGDFTISLTVTTPQGCQATNSKSNFILVYPQPKAGFDYTPYELYVEDATISIIDQSSGSIYTKWDFGDGTTATQQPPQHQYKNPGIYLITQQLTNKFNCKSSISKSVLVRERKNIYIPNVFTPGVGDGVNDVFLPVVTGSLVDQKYEMRIFDRWGLEIFFSPNLDEGWNGRYKGEGEIVPFDVYVYQIQFFNKTTGDRIAKFVGRVTTLK